MQILVFLTYLKCQRKCFVQSNPHQSIAVAVVYGQTYCTESYDLYLYKDLKVQHCKFIGQWFTKSQNTIAQFIIGLATVM